MPVASVPGKLVSAVIAGADSGYNPFRYCIWSHDAGGGCVLVLSGVNTSRDGPALVQSRRGAEIDLITHIADRLRYIEGNLFWDATPEVRFGVAGIYTTVTYLDGEAPHNIRGKFTATYFF